MTQAVRRGPEPPAAIWLVTSLVLHAGIALVLLWGGGAWVARVGEHGHGGAGGPADEVEVSIVQVDPSSDPASDPARTSHSAAPSSASPEPGPVTDEQASPETRATSRGTSERVEDPARGTMATEPAPSGEASGASVGTSESGPPPEGAAQHDDGDGHASSSAGTTGVGEEARALILGSAGRLEGSSVRASALLGESLSCDDPIAGTWVAYRYSPEFRDWARFTLRITHEGASLRGTIVARMWRGLPSDRRPPPCSAEGWDYTVTMQATGNLIGDRMAFGASTHEVTRVDCASTLFAYNPDHFSGSVDPLADRMHTVNNDGGRDVNAPYEFRRTGCEP
ncbi:MAG: hypothetical protein U0353_32450 [Sandaracinus sp.]